MASEIELYLDTLLESGSKVEDGFLAVLTDVITLGFIGELPRKILFRSDGVSLVNYEKK